MPAVRVEDRARRDWRVAELGRLCGRDRRWALGALIDIWSECTDQNVYALQAPAINVLVEHQGFAQAMVQAQLAEIQEDGMVRIKGTRGRIEWLHQARQGAAVGGQTAKQRREDSDTRKYKQLQEELFPDTNAIQMIPHVSVPHEHSLSSFFSPTNISTNTHASPAAPAGVCVGDLEAIYAGYPLKKGKTRGMAIAKAKIKTPRDLSELARAVEAYKRQIQKEGTQPQYIKHFCTFMGCWQDFLEPEPVIAPSPARPVSVIPVVAAENLVDENEAKSLVDRLRGSLVGRLDVRPS